MNRTHKIGTMAVAIACAACVETMGASTVLREFFDDTISLVPNQLDVTLFERVTYTDNVKNSHYDRIDSIHFDTGVAVDAYRNVGDFSYGLTGELSYDYYTKRGGDMNQWSWNLAPFVKGSSVADIHNLKIGFNMTGKIEPLSNSNVRYARHYTTKLFATYDYARHEHWGILLNGSYKYDYYPQDEFEDFNKQVFTGSIAPYYRFDADLKTGVRAQWEKTIYDTNKVQSDNLKQTYNVFADYRMNSFFETYAEAGIEKKSYSGRRRGTNEDRDWNWNFLGALRYYPTLRTKIELKSELDVEDSTAGGVRGGAAFVWDNSLALTWKPESKYDFTTKIGAETQDEKNNNSDTTEYYFTVRGNYRFNEHLNFYAQYKYDTVQFKYNHRDHMHANYYENEITLGVTYRF